MRIRDKAEDQIWVNFIFSRSLYIKNYRIEAMLNISYILTDEQLAEFESSDPFIEVCS